MDTIAQFKKIIILDLILTIVMIITGFFSPEEYTNFMLDTLVIINETTMLLIAAILTFLYFISLYLCYKFNSLGKNIYILTFVSTLFFVLFMDYASTGLEISLTSLGGAVSGVIIYMMIYTEIKDKFT
tara:strand:+ start:729 stop:1112 length:384 start_codon:yes stop_codon:yes gene_type:complete